MNTLPSCFIRNVENWNLPAWAFAFAFEELECLSRAGHGCGALSPFKFRRIGTKTRYRKNLRIERLDRREVLAGDSLSPVAV